MCRPVLGVYAFITPIHNDGASGENHPTFTHFTDKETKAQRDPSGAQIPQPGSGWQSWDWNPGPWVPCALLTLPTLMDTCSGLWAPTLTGMACPLPPCVPPSPVASDERTSDCQRLWGCSEPGLRGTDSVPSPPPRASQDLSSTPQTSHSQLGPVWTFRDASFCTPHGSVPRGGLLFPRSHLNLSARP